MEEVLQQLWLCPRCGISWVCLRATATMMTSTGASSAASGPRHMRRAQETALHQKTGTSLRQMAPAMTLPLLAQPHAQTCQNWSPMMRMRLTAKLGRASWPAVQGQVGSGQAQRAASRPRVAPSALATWTYSWPPRHSRAVQSLVLHWRVQWAVSHSLGSGLGCILSSASHAASVHRKLIRCANNALVAWQDPARQSAAPAWPAWRQLVAGSRHTRSSHSGWMPLTAAGNLFTFSLPWLRGSRPSTTFEIGYLL